MSIIEEEKNQQLTKDKEDSRYELLIKEFPTANLFKVGKNSRVYKFEEDKGMILKNYLPEEFERMRKSEDPEIHFIYPF